jgi:hypothetical protein
MLFLPEQKIARKEHLISMAVPARRAFSPAAMQDDFRSRPNGAKLATARRVVNGVMARRRFDQNPPQYGGTP